MFNSLSFQFFTTQGAPNCHFCRVRVPPNFFWFQRVHSLFLTVILLPVKYVVNTYGVNFGNILRTNFSYERLFSMYM